MILRCPRCLKEIEGDFSTSNPPGKCPCGAWANWLAVKKRLPDGHVIVMSSRGWQKLDKDRNYVEDNKAWQPYPIKKVGN